MDATGPQRRGFGIPNHVGKIAIGTTLLSMGVVLAGVGMNVFPSNRIVHWPEIVASGLFAAVLVGIGAVPFAAGVRTAVARSGRRVGPFALRLSGCLVSRVTPRTALAALPYLLLAIQFHVYRRTGTPLLPGSGEGLKEVLGIEFAVIHSTMFMGLVALVPATGRGRAAKVGLIVLFGGFYVAVTASHATTWGLASFVFLLVSKYVGYWLRPPAAGRKLALFLRWGAQFLAFVLACAITGNRRFSGVESIAPASWYFSLLTAFELVALFSVEVRPGRRSG